MTVAGINVTSFGKRLLKEMSEDDVTGMAAELSYRYFLALFPFFIFLAALGGFFADAANIRDPSGRVIESLGDALPSDAKSVLETQLRGVLDSQSAGLLSIGAVGALWAASGGVKSTIKALNRVYDVPETRPFWKSTLLSIVLLLAGTIGILGSVVIYFTITPFASNIADKVGAGSVFALILSVAQYPLITLLILTAVGMMYWLAPNMDQPFKWITPGAVLFTFVWIAATVLFGIYVTNFGSYNKTYGALGGVIVLLTWLYLTNVMLLVGAEVNALLQAEKEPETTRRQRETIGAKASDSQQKQAMEPRAERRPTPAAEESTELARSPLTPVAASPTHVQTSAPANLGGWTLALIFVTAFGLAALTARKH